MFVKTKEELLEYIKGLTDGFRGEEPERFTASAISARLNVSRNLTSQYLNELVKDGLLVKAFSAAAGGNNWRCAGKGPFPARAWYHGRCENLSKGPKTAGRMRECA